MREIRLNGHGLARLSESVLAGGGSLRFKARGFSMHPLIRDGDTTVVRPCNADDLHVGTVVFYRTASGIPVAHRILLNSGKAVLVRGDASNSRIEPVEPHQVMGVVAAVERDPETLRLDCGYWKIVGALIATFPWLGPCFGSPGELARKLAAAGLHAIQRCDLYRALATRTIGRSISCRVATAADSPQLASFYQYDRFPDIAKPAKWMARHMAQLDRYGAYVCAVMRGRIVGAAVVRRFSGEETRYPDWWLFGLGVRTIVRGAGIGERLVELAMKTAQSRGAHKVHLLVDENNKVALSLYAKLGFVQACIPGLQQLLDEEAVLGNPRQIGLMKQLT